MKAISYKHLAIGLAMLAAAGMAIAMKPSEKFTDKRAEINLETMIPKAFGDWRLEATLDQLVSPDVKAEIDKIYNQTLTRTYVNSKDQRIMLSIAYGGDQSDSLQVHMPEGCYRGQGFDVPYKNVGIMNVGDANLPVTRLIAEKGQRVEPITYWLLIGGKDFAYSRLDRKLVKLRYTLTGSLPDGMLVRVSNIGLDAEPSWALHQAFVRSMLSTMPPAARLRLSGSV